MSEFSLNSLWSEYSKNGDRLVLGIYNQLPGFTIFMKNHTGKPLFRMSLSHEMIIYMKEVLHSLINSTGEKTASLFSQRKDFNTKEVIKNAQISFMRDDKGIFYIECKSKSLGDPVTFRIKGNNTYNSNGDGITQEMRSKHGILALCDKLDHITTAMWLSPYVPPKKFNNNGRSAPSGGSDAIFD